MKKHLKALLICGVSLLLLLLLASCGKKETLNTPGGLSLDDDYRLGWSSVESARTYTVEVKNEAGEQVLLNTTRETTCSLAGLPVGNYEIRVMATGGADYDVVSPWSEALHFHRDYESGCTYELINGNSEYRIVRSNNASGDVLIEANYRGKPVTEIAENAFKGNRNVEKLTLGENIRKIGENAFYGCVKLESITIPDGVTSIGVSAFQGCRSLTGVNIPKGLRTIPEYCFAYCRALTSVEIGDQITAIDASAFTNTALTTVTIPDGVAVIGEYAFASISGLTEITVGREVVALGDYTFSENAELTKVTFAEGSALTSLGSHCFSGNHALAGITLPESLTEIGDFCFYDCGLIDSIHIPAGVTHIGRRAFNATKIYSDTEGDFVYADKWLVAVKNLSDYKKIQPTDFRQDTVGIADNCFAVAKELETVELASSIETIGQYAFAQCPVLSEFRVGKSLIRIRLGAFYQCENLSGLYLRAKNTDADEAALKEIGEYAFAGCSVLDNNELNPIIPNSVEKIGSNAFVNTRLWNTPDEYNIIYAGNWVVGYTANAKLGDIELKDSVRGVADYAFTNCASLTIPKNLSKCLYIGEGAFYNCSSLESVVLHSRITKLPDYVFYKCSNLFQVSFSGLLESVGRSSFYKCTTLKELDFSKTRAFKSIGMYAFYGCTNLTEIKLGNELTDIGAYAFSHCSALAAVEIPDKVTTLPSHVFAYCSAMKTLSVGSGVSVIGPYAFYKCSMLASAELPDALKTISADAFYKCYSLQTLSLGNSLESIGDYAFYNTGLITSLRLPASLKRIGKYAFKSAESLKTVIIPSGVTEIGSNAFYGCRNATFYVEENANTNSWNLRWNSSGRPVIQGARLSDTRDYVVQITLAASPVLNSKSLSESYAPIADPERSGYTFKGWQKQDGTLLTTAQLAGEPAGTVLTAVFEPNA